MINCTAAAAEIAWNRDQDRATSYIRSDFEAKNPQPVQDGIVLRMDEVARFGKYDKTNDGLRRNRRGMVGDVLHTCQVATQGSDTLIIFWSDADGHQRRFLIDALGRLWMDNARGKAVRQKTKYDDAISRIMAVRNN